MTQFFPLVLQKMTSCRRLSCCFLTLQFRRADDGQPCHRCIASTGYIGGFQGDWRDAPSGLNIEKKLKLLKEEGVEFDERGMLKDKTQYWDSFKV